jgi:hypothetical protein
MYMHPDAWDGCGHLFFLLLLSISFFFSIGGDLRCLVLLVVLLSSSVATCIDCRIRGGVAQQVLKNNERVM